VRPVQRGPDSSPGSSASATPVAAPSLSCRHLHAPQRAFGPAHSPRRLPEFRATATRSVARVLIRQKCRKLRLHTHSPRPAAACMRVGTTLEQEAAGPSRCFQLHRREGNGSTNATPSKQAGVVYRRCSVEIVARRASRRARRPRGAGARPVWRFGITENTEHGGVNGRGSVFSQAGAVRRRWPPHRMP
jgi:hypothetical protein